MVKSLIVALALIPGQLAAATIEVEVLEKQGEPLPGALVNLVEVLPTGERGCRIAEQAIATEEGIAIVGPAGVGAYKVVVELSGFLGVQIGPFRVAQPRDGASEAPAELTVILHDACLPCVSQPIAIEYVLTEECGGSYPSR